MSFLYYYFVSEPIVKDAKSPKKRLAVAKKRAGNKKVVEADQDADVVVTEVPKAGILQTISKLSLF